MARSGRSASSRTAARPASRAAGRPASAEAPASWWTSLLRYSPSPRRGSSSTSGEAGMSRSSCTTAPPPTSGHVREVNEDAFLVAPPVFVVADGMGGHDGGDVASAIVVEEFAPARRGGLRPAPRRRGRRRDARRAARAGSRSTPRSSSAATHAALARRHHRVVGRAGRGRRGHQVAARQPRRLPDLPLQRRRARPGQRRPLRRPGARRRRRDHRRGGRHPPGAARHHPRARRPGASRPTSSCCRSPRPSGCCCAATGSAG